MKSKKSFGFKILRPQPLMLVDVVPLEWAGME